MSESHKGKHPSEETREKMRQRMLGDNNPSKRPEVKEKLREINTGRILSLETREKISKAQIGQKRPEQSERMKGNKIAVGRVGHPMSDKTKKLIGEANRGKHNGYKFERGHKKLEGSGRPKGSKNPHTEKWNEKISESHKGVPLSEEHKENLRLSHLSPQNLRLMELGIPFEKHNTSAYDEWREKVKSRDNYECQLCHSKNNDIELVIKDDELIYKRVKVFAHHIKDWAVYPEERYNVENGITLCEDCHNLVTWHSDKLYGQ